jgi:hypothetical protein
VGVRGGMAVDVVRMVMGVVRLMCLV